jgi:glycosyltransferase involved in cell wall biosynthesis
MAKIYRKKVVIHMHGAEFMMFYNQELSKRQRKYVHKIFVMADSVIALSKEWKQNLDTILGEKAAKVIVNAVIVPEEKSIKGNHTLLFLGRIGQRKGVYDLLKALRIVAETFPDFQLIIGGDGEAETLLQKSRVYNLQSYIQYVGWVSGEEKERLLKTSSILVLPSYNEGMPMSVLEGMSYGLPIVSTTVGGIPNLVTHGVEGYLLKPGDIQGLAKYILKLLEDNDLRKTMGEAARKRIEEEFSINTSIEALVSLYHEVA